MASPVPKTAANTPGTYYIDTPNAKVPCKTERSLIEKKCKPEPAQSEEDKKNNKPRAKRKGLGGAIAKATEKFDEASKGSAGYNRDNSTSATSGNAWMDDHCSGLWITPNRSLKNSPEIEGIKKKLEEVADKLDGGIMAWLGMLKDAVGELADVAREMVSPKIVDDIMEEMALKMAAKGVIGAVGGETIIVPILMALWTAYDLYSTAKLLADLAGDKGKAALQAFESIWDIDDKVEEILADIKDNPVKAMTNLMTLLAQMDPCIRARKCMLVPYKNTDGKPTKAVAQARHGQGCCPGQTGHHILPDSMTAGRCPGYDHGDAPVICLEGTSNSAGWGSHGAAHQNLKAQMEEYRRERYGLNKSPNTISYKEASKRSIEAVRAAGARQCDAACLQAQLDAHYNNCGGQDLVPTDGTGEFKPRPEPTIINNNDSGE